MEKVMETVGRWIEKHGDGHMICAFRDPSGVFSAEMFRRVWRDVEPIDGGYEISRDFMLMVYRAWRKCFAQGYPASEFFNVGLGEGIYNPMIPPEKHYTFDIRLGYLIYMDRRCQLTIGKGDEVYSPKTGYRMGVINPWMFDRHVNRWDKVPLDEENA